MVLTQEGRVEGVIQPMLFSLHGWIPLKVCRRPVSLFLSLEVIPRFLPLNRDLH